MTTRSLGALACVLLSCALLMSGCGTEPRARDVTATLDEHRMLGKPIVADNLTVWPIYTDAPLEIGEFLTLQEAQARKVAVIRELGAGPGAQQMEAPAAAGSEVSPSVPPVSAPPATNPPVPGAPTREGLGRVFNPQVGDQQLNPQDSAEVGRVVIENTGTLPILVVAGTIIDGGKQDRQIGQDFVIAAGETVNVDAFCVEHGRWQGDSQELVEGACEAPTAMTPSFNASTAAGIAPKQVRSAGQYDKDQAKVWSNVDASNQELNTSNPTQTLMGTIELADEETKAKRAAQEKAIADAFAALAGSKRAPIGFAYAINGKPVTVRTFAHARILTAQLPLFLKAMSIEAHMGAGKATKPVSARDVITMVRGIQKASKEEITSTGASNVNGYSKNAVGFNARCYLKPAMLKKLAIEVGPNKVILTEDWTAK